MLRKMKLYLLVALLWATESLAGQLSAKVEPQQVRFGEAVQLAVSFEGTDSGVLQPQFGVLNKDFAIYSTSTSMQTQYINGVGQQIRTWNLILMPQKEGKLTIPAITAGNYQTVPLDIEVLPASSPAVRKPAAVSSADDSLPDAAMDSGFWMEMSSDTDKAYIQQQINTTLVIYDGKNIQFTEDPVFENADDWKVRQLGEPSVTEKNGQRIIKLKYAFFPQKSGTLYLPSVRVSGFYIEQSRSNVTRSVNGFLRFFDIDMDMLNLTGQQKPVLLKTKPIKVEVKPIPADYGNEWWLPATSVNLRAKWVDERPVFKTGEAVTREIVLTAGGVDDTQLPELEFADNPDWKQYPENPILTTAVKGSQVEATSVTRVVYIPQRGGEQMLPEIKIRWFNVKTQHIEKASIPAEKMYVGGEIKQPQPAPQIVPETNTADNAGQDAAASTKKMSLFDKLQSSRDIVVILLVVIGAFLCGILFNYLFLRKHVVATEDMSAEEAVKDIERNLKRADYRALRNDLLRWGEVYFADEYISNLNDLSEKIGAKEFTEQMQKLNLNLYAGGNEPIDGKIILQYVKKHQKSGAKVKQSPLPDLYK